MGLQRFVDAQDFEGTYQKAAAELRAGKKRSHWMWFVFPQIVGLGTSQRALRFSIASLDEARRYAEHPILGARLREACDILAGLTGLTSNEIFGRIDALKLRSSMTLFARAVPEEPRFQDILNTYYSGKPDPATDERLREIGCAR